MRRPMSANQLVQLLTQVLFVLVFAFVAARAVRQPRRANVDTAVLFGAVALLVVEEWASEALGINQTRVLSWAFSSLLIALPYLLMRLVDDFAQVPRTLMHVAEAGLGLSVVCLGALAALPLWVSL